jgi:hypothetical protein
LGRAGAIGVGAAPSRRCTDWLTAELKRLGKQGISVKTRSFYRWLQTFETEGVCIDSRRAADALVVNGPEWKVLRQKIHSLTFPRLQSPQAILSSPAPKPPEHAELVELIQAAIDAQNIRLHGYEKPRVGEKVIWETILGLKLRQWNAVDPESARKRAAGLEISAAISVAAVWGSILHPFNDEWHIALDLLMTTDAVTIKIRPAGAEDKQFYILDSDANGHVRRTGQQKTSELPFDVKLHTTQCASGRVPCVVAIMKCKEVPHCNASNAIDGSFLRIKCPGLNPDKRSIGEIWLLKSPGDAKHVFALTAAMRDDQVLPFVEQRRQELLGEPRFPEGHPAGRPEMAVWLWDSQIQQTQQLVAEAQKLNDADVLAGKHGGRLTPFYQGNDVNPGHQGTKHSVKTDKYTECVDDDRIKSLRIIVEKERKRVKKDFAVSISLKTQKKVLLLAAKLMGSLPEEMRPSVVVKGYSKPGLVVRKGSKITWDREKVFDRLPAWKVYKAHPAEAAVIRAACGRLAETVRAGKLDTATVQMMKEEGLDLPELLFVFG